MKDVKTAEVNEISGGALPGSVGELIETGTWRGISPYDPSGPTPGGPFVPVEPSFD
jgi:hypothetical protein